MKIGQTGDDEVGDFGLGIYVSPLLVSATEGEGSRKGLRGFYPG